MKSLLKFVITSLFITSISFAQGSAGTNAKFEYRSLIDMQTAGILEKGYVGVGMDVWILYVELGYEMGLSPVFDSELLDTDAKNNAFLFTIGANLF